MDTDKRSQIYQQRLPQMLDVVKNAGVVIDVGGGRNSFEAATHVIDIQKRYESENPQFIGMNICTTPFPFADKSVDFVHCTHTLEDIECPEFVLNEILRVGKAGYIECPSVMLELHRGLRELPYVYRGYSHHRWFVYIDNDGVELLPKYPVVEYMTFVEEDVREIILRCSPVESSNGSLLWTKPFNVKVYRLNMDYSFKDGTYESIIMSMIDRELARLKGWAM